jgi:hypothetical protein
MGRGQVSPRSEGPEGQAARFEYLSAKVVPIERQYQPLLFASRQAKHLPKFSLPAACKVRPHNASNRIQFGPQQTSRLFQSLKVCYFK